MVTMGDDCGGDWELYLRRQYEQFRADFIDSQPNVFHPKRWAIKRHPVSQGKEATFWHVTSTGTTEDERIPEMRRMERLGWIRPMIDAIKRPEAVCSWVEVRNGDLRPNIALPDFSYIVVLSERNDYVMLWTAYFVEFAHQRERLKKKWQSSQGI
jgi:hypothetical protein